MKNISIYIVEDSTIVSLELEKKLRSMGYNISGSAITGEDAVKECMEMKPDLILMDIKLPGKINGIEAARSIRDSFDIPVIFTTAYSDKETIARVKEASPFGYLIKPYGEKDLMVAIETAMTRHDYERKLEESEKKYRNLFDGSEDILFTLDENFNVITVNRAVFMHLKLTEKDVVSGKFLDMIYVSPNENMKTRDFIEEKLEQFSKNKGSMVFKTRFKVSKTAEPVEMSVKLEYIDLKDKSIIMGRAYRVIEDELLNFFVSEKQNLVMGNQLALVNDISDRLTRNLKKYIDSDSVELIRISLTEILVNAIEHGNLEMSFEDKTEKISTGNYFSFIEERQNDPEYMDRTVHIEFAIEPGEARYTITDDGKGFDYNNFLNKDFADEDIHLLSHGRGLLLSQKIFDEITFNDHGNMVTLIKKIHSQEKKSF